MTSRSVFKLKVLHHKDDESCSFLLLWDGGKKDIYISLKYPKELQLRYQRWQQRYCKYYQFPLPQPAQKTRSIALSSGDLAHDLREAEEELLTAFQRWLAEGEAHKIRDQIRDELTLAQTASARKQKFHRQHHLDIFLSCSSELARLPWEAWQLAPNGIPPGTVRIVRTTMEEQQGSIHTPLRRGKTRILAILADDPKLPLTEDWKILRSLRSIADIQRVTWEPDENPVGIKNKIAEAIASKPGWDVLFFAGHSNETTATGGQVAIAPDIFLSINQLEEQLTQARANGLQLAIFNSCNGLSIANSLTQLGLQVVVMREPIHNDVAVSFLKRFCQHLAKREDVLDSLLGACNYLQSEQKFVHPSAYLIPSFFSPPGASPWQPKSDGKGAIEPWLPTWREAIALSATLMVSLMVPVQDLLLDFRTFAQAVYRNTTGQFPPDRQPPVLLIALDQESINRAMVDIKGFEIKPMDREYLAKLVTRLANLNFRSIGIDYLLDTEEPKQDKLANSIKAAVSQQKIWFVFGIDEQSQLKVFPKIASSNWSLQGDITHSDAWDIELPKDATCTQSCPFAYILALSHILNQENAPADLPQPHLQNPTDFGLKISNYLKHENNQNQALAALKQQVHSPFGLRSIIDFSIPPDQAYKWMPALVFLKRNFPTSELQQGLKRQTVIIASGGYTDAEDNFSVPIAVSYWCHWQNWQERRKKDCPEVFTGGEAHAYRVHHLLGQHQLVLLPDILMIGLAAILGKWTTLILLKQKRQHEQKWVLVLMGTTVAYGIVGLQVYVSASVCLPWFLPSVMFWILVLQSQGRVLT
ncbi:MAG TPA: histidine kinase [Cyanobacteria bacterium UBA8803]|nr:histidine kinase [Cyanobacteria bacterium UBA9273]HBL59554.1 histidine kinase [Cyanobacteria bacterium UBA8803]